MFGLPRWCQLQRICLPMQETWETWVQYLGWEDAWRREWQPTPVFLPGDPMDRGPGEATEHRFTDSQTLLEQLSTYATFSTKPSIIGTQFIICLFYHFLLPRKCTGHSKHPFPTTQEKTLHMDITRWSTPKSDWLYSLQPKMEKHYTVSKNKTRSWL